MEDYPRTITEFESRFSTEAGCREYLVQLRWPEGYDHEITPFRGQLKEVSKRLPRVHRVRAAETLVIGNPSRRHQLPALTVLPG
jgi:hypothetical protein